MERTLVADLENAIDDRVNAVVDERSILTRILGRENFVLRGLRALQNYFAPPTRNPLLPTTAPLDTGLLRDTRRRDKARTRVLHLRESNKHGAPTVQQKSLPLFQPGLKVELPTAIPGTLPTELPAHASTEAGGSARPSTPAAISQKAITAKSKYRPSLLRTPEKARYGLSQIPRSLHFADDDLIIYTDGSWLPEDRAAGCGIVYWNGFRWVGYAKALGALEQAVMSELEGVYEGISYAKSLLDRYHRRLIIRTDCQEVVTYYSKVKSSRMNRRDPRYSEIFYLDSRISNRGYQVKVEWVGGHGTSIGNQVSDRLTKKGAEATKDERSGDIFVSDEEMVHIGQTARAAAQRKAFRRSR